MPQILSPTYRKNVALRNFSLALWTTGSLAIFGTVISTLALHIYAPTYRDQIAQLVLNQEESHLPDWVSLQCPPTTFQVLCSDMQFDNPPLQEVTLDQALDLLTPYKQTGVTHVTIGSPGCIRTARVTARWSLMPNPSFFASREEPFIRVEVGEVDGGDVVFGIGPRSAVKDTPLTASELPSTEPGQPGPGTAEYNRHLVDMARQRALAEQAAHKQ